MELLNKFQSDIVKLFHTKSSRFIIWTADRRQGKSFTVCNIAIETCKKKPNSKSVIISPNQLTSKSVHRYLIKEQVFDDVKFNVSNNCFEFPNGSCIYLKSGKDVEWARGTTFDYIAIDEAEYIEDLQYKLYSILYPCIVRTEGKIIISSTIETKRNEDLNKLVLDSLSSDSLINTMGL